jgi:uncharacterized membrane protein (DUF485 family)
LPTHATLEAVSAARWRIAITLTVVMMAVYFGFILLVAFNKPLLGMLIAPGLSLGMLLGALVIVVAWVLIWIYVEWANRHYDASVRGLRPSTTAQGAPGHAEGRPSTQATAAPTLRRAEGRPEPGRGTNREGRR